MNLPCVCLSGDVLLYFSFWRIGLPGIKFWVDNFLSKDIIPLLSGFHGFWWLLLKISCMRQVASFLLLLRFSLCHLLPIIWLLCALVWISLHWSFLEFVELLDYVDSYLLSYSGTFQPLVIQTFFLLLSSLFFLLDSHCSCSHTVMLPHRSLRLC